MGLMTVTHFVGSRLQSLFPTGSRTHPWLYSGIPSGFRKIFCDNSVPLGWFQRCSSRWILKSDRS